MPDPDDYFDEAAAKPSASTTDTEEQAPRDEEAKGEEQTALIPKAFLGGKEPEIGETLTVRVEQILDEEVSVSMVSEEEGEEKPPEESKAQGPPPGATPGGMGGMLE